MRWRLTMPQNTRPVLVAKVANFYTTKPVAFEKPDTQYAILWVSILLLFVGVAGTARAQVVRRYIVMRVDFQDSTTAPRYTRQEVEQQLANVTDLFTENSNKTVQVEFVVTDLFRLPKNAADYSSANMEVTIQDAL